MIPVMVPCQQLIVSVPAPSHLVDIHGQVPSDVLGGQVAHRRQSQPGDEGVGVLQVHLDGVGDEGEDLLVLGQQQAQAQVPDALLIEVRRGDQLQALHLAEVTAHMERFQPIALSAQQFLLITTTAVVHAPWVPQHMNE